MAKALKIALVVLGLAVGYVALNVVVYTDSIGLPRAYGP
jgi:hypothetical protein